MHPVTQGFSRAVHFGAYQDAPDDGQVPTVYGYSEPEGLDAPIVLGNGLERFTRAFVSGSWACWGPADNGYDEATGDRGDGDNSIHVVVYVADHIDITPDFLLALRWAVYDGDGPGADYRLLDYAVLSDSDDWSVQTGVVTYRGNPQVVIHPTR